ncbi:MAG: hypothetical protein Solivirus4_23 [Solivirus sp.]|uniref:Uncharacterized protein n=1 Tax=Solivirus sp. TaxID=2487772 RepID=A0A3G5AFV7_9VIRU|nr:MAG: hypothetical protein Solivirus4_23 [Solivirus sp.]
MISDRSIRPSKIGIKSFTKWFPHYIASPDFDRFRTLKPFNCALNEQEVLMPLIGETNNKILSSCRGMKYFDFEANWDQFLNLLKSTEIVQLLSHFHMKLPLSSIVTSDGIYMVIDGLTQSDEEYKFLQATYSGCGNNCDLNDCDECQETFSEIFNYIFNKYDQDYMIHVQIPMHWGHQMAHILFRMAQIMYPNYQWIIVEGDVHSTVYTKDGGGIVFDLLRWYLHRTSRSPNEFHPELVLANALGKRVHGYSNNENHHYSTKSSVVTNNPVTMEA